MPKKKQENKIAGIKPEFGSILVCNKRHLRPFIEIIMEEPKNVSHQNLGTLIGVLEITDTSEDSSYVVNYLISVIKKEYFSKYKRGPIESLEAALHKANLALASLAEHENIGWLGNLNALIAVVEKNNLHLSQTGTASAFLLRSKILTDISEGLSSPEEEPYPLKTFVNVSSGRLQENDKLIITTANIFDIFSLEEIKKSALRFSDQEFVQFLKTALGNELEKAAVLVADLKLLKEEAVEKIITPKKELNAFSKDAFVEAAPKAKPREIEKEIEEEVRRKGQEFVDKKTGHIYIKEADESFDYPRAKTGHGKMLSEKMSSWAGSLWRMLENIRLPRSISFGLPSFLKPDLDIRKIKTASIGTFRRAGAGLKDMFSKMEKPAKNGASGAASAVSKTFSQEKRHRAIYLLKKAMPDLSRIRKSLGLMGYQQKIYVALALAIIFIGPVFIIKIQDWRKDQKISESEMEIVPEILPVENDIRIAKIEEPSVLFSGKNILWTLNLNEKAFAITATDIIDIEEGISFPIPQEFGLPIKAIGMEDLNLIFLLNDGGKITSYSPASDKFAENNISIPTDSEIVSMGSYLTYIYLADRKNSQIYRYPRAEGGFGEKSDWLRDTLDLSGMTAMAINENIFVSTGSDVTKLFRGKIEALDLEKTTVPLNISGIALGEETGDLFVLDKENSRIVSYGEGGMIKVQYYHPEISSASGLALDEKNGLIYITSEESVRTIPLQ